MKRTLALLLAVLMLTALLPLTAAAFADVPEDAYYAVPVVWAVEQGIAKGTSGTAFSPDATCTRAQVVMFLWREADEPEPQTTENPFADVDMNAYYGKAVLWAAEQNITKGTSADAFCPDDGCTRAQVVSFLYRAAREPDAGTAGGFTDVAADAYYAGAVNWAAAQGITKGTGGTTFSPDASCTRAQIVTFLYRSVAHPAELTVCTMERETEYDPDGSESFVRTTEWEYDDHGNNVKMIVRASGAVEAVWEQTFDRSGNILTHTEKDNDGQVCLADTFTYDKDGKMLTHSVSAGDGEIYGETYTYDANGNLIRKECSGADGGYTTNYTYDGDRLVQETTQDSDGRISGISYSYDENGRLSERVGTVGQGSWVFKISFRYDENGNVVSETDQYDIHTITLTYAYDENGNMLKKTEAWSDYDPVRTWSRTYDDRGNLVHEIFDDFGMVSETTSYTYDANGNLIRADGKNSDGYIWKCEYKYNTIFVEPAPNLQPRMVC